MNTFSFYLKPLFFAITFIGVCYTYSYSVVLGTGIFCWWVMILMLSMLSSDEENYQRRLSQARRHGLRIQFSCIKIAKIINIDYFKLACEKAFEWTYVTVLWVTGMSNLFNGLGLINKTQAMFSISSSVSALAGIAWCLPALVYYTYKKKWFNAYALEEINNASFSSNVSSHRETEEKSIY